MATGSLLLIQAVLKYFAYEIVTTITVRQEIPARMPTIIMCNSNGLLTNTGAGFASKVYPAYNITKQKNYMQFQVNFFARQLNNKGNILTPRTIVISAAKNPKLSDSFRQSLGLTMKDMLISCEFNSIECTAADFSWFFDAYYGSCYTFNLSGLGNVKKVN